MSALFRQKSTHWPLLMDFIDAIIVNRSFDFSHCKMVFCCFFFCRSVCCRAIARKIQLFWADRFSEVFWINTRFIDSWHNINQLWPHHFTCVYVRLFAWKSEINNSFYIVCIGVSAVNVFTVLFTCRLVCILAHRK